MSIAQNRKARFNYEIIEKLEAGICLTGSEIKSIRENKNPNIAESYIYIDMNNEAWLKGANISIYKNATYNNHDPLRIRKLLLHKKEALRLNQKVHTQGLTIVPMALYWGKGSKVKVEIALVKGKKLWDKRQTIKKRDIERETGRKLK